MLTEQKTFNLYEDDGEDFLFEKSTFAVKL